MTETGVAATEFLRRKLHRPDVGVVQHVNTWLSGVLAGEIFVFAVLPHFRTVEPATTSTDWLVAVGGAVLSVAILAVVIRHELGND